MPARLGTVDVPLPLYRIELEGEIDALLEKAWCGLDDLAWPLKFELEKYCLPSGKWRDFLAHTAYRPLDFASKLFLDFEVPRTNRQIQLERQLYCAAHFEFVAILLNELLIGAESTFSYEHSLISAGLVSQADWFLSSSGIDPCVLRGYSVKFWNEHGNALLTHHRYRTQRSLPYRAEDFSSFGKRWAPLKMPAVVAVLWADRESMLPELLRLLDEAAALYQLGRELGDLNRDPARGSCSYPIAQLMASVGMQFGVTPNSNQVLLAAYAAPLCQYR